MSTKRALANSVASPGGNEEADLAVLKHVRNATHAGCNNRPASSHCLENDHWGCLGE